MNERYFFFGAADGIETFFHIKAILLHHFTKVGKNLKKLLYPEGVFQGIKAFFCEIS